MKTDKFDIVLRSVAGIPLAFYGYAFQKAWISISSVPSLGVPRFDLIPSGVLNAVIILLFACIALRFDSRKVRTWGFGVGIALQFVVVALMAVLPSLSQVPVALLVLLSLANAGGVALVSALWIDLYAMLNPVRVAFLNAAVILIAQALIFVVEGNEPLRILAVLVVVPLLTAACFSVATHKSEAEKPAVRKSSARFLFPYKAVLFIAAYSFAYGVAVLDVGVVNARYSSVVPATIVLVLVVLNTKRFSISMLFRLAFPLMVAGFLLVSLIPGVLHPYSAFLLTAGFSAMEMLLMLMVCTIAYSSGTSAIWLFGVLGGAQFLMREAGVALGTFASSSLGSSDAVVLNVVAVVLVIVASLALMSEKSLFSFWNVRAGRNDGAEVEAVSEGGGAASPDDSIEVRVNAISASYALTDRETEVLYLAAQGKTNLQIGRDMFISEGTVKAHLSHIYHKFGIHTRKELMSIVESGVKR